jgi:hypothetical protein
MSKGLSEKFAKLRTNRGASEIECCREPQKKNLPPGELFHDRFRRNTVVLGFGKELDGSRVAVL